MNAPHPFHFEGGRLFGCLHLPATPQPVRVAVLMVQPLFGEYVQYHRAYFLLAEHLRKRGVPAMRYDHFGTGDSASDLHEALFEHWVTDVGLCVRELRKRSGASRVLLVGARLGAAVTVAAAADLAHMVGAVLWDPVWVPAQHLDELVEVRRRTLGRYLKQPDSGLPGPDGSWDILGFHCSGALAESIRSAQPRIEHVSHELEILAIGGSVAGWRPPRTHYRVAIEEVPYPRGWLDPQDGIYDVLVPVEVLNRVECWILDRA